MSRWPTPRRPLLSALGNGAIGGLAGGLLALVIDGAIGAVSGSLRFGPDLLWLGPLVYGGGFALLGCWVGGLIAGVPLFRSRREGVAVGAGFSGSLLIAAFLFNRWAEPGSPGGDGISGGTDELVISPAVVAVGVAALGLLLVRTQPPRLSRRGLGALTIAVYAAAGVAGAVTSPSYRPSEARPVFQRKPDVEAPNVILIVVDTLRADSLSLYNPDARARTPNLRALAEDAVLFEHFVAQGSWTKPAFGSIFSSRHPSSHTATQPSSVLPDEVTTLAEVLLESGFYTCAFANNPNVSLATNFDQGFVQFIDVRSPRAPFTPPFPTQGLAIFDRLLRRFPTSRKANDLSASTFYAPANEVTRRVFDWLDGASAPPNAPLHLMIHYMDPHDPYMNGQLRGPGYSSYQLRKPNERADLEPMKASYEGDIEFLDEYLGILLAGLRQRGLFENSIIIVTSDHGEEFFEHSGWWHGEALYEELVRIPLLMKLPGGSGAGAVHRGVVSQIDLAPTVLSMLGIAPPPEMQGVAVVDSAGEPAAPRARYAFSETNVRGHQLLSIRSRDAKLIYSLKGGRHGPGAIEYYQLSRDPREALNLAQRGLPEEGALRRRLEQHAEASRREAASPISRLELDRREAERLRALGYVSD